MRLQFWCDLAEKLIRDSQSQGDALPLYHRHTLFFLNDNGKKRKWVEKRKKLKIELDLNSEFRLPSLPAYLILSLQHTHTHTDVPATL